MTLNWANFSLYSLYFSMETRKIDLTQQEMELISLCVDMMSDPESNLPSLEALLAPADLAAFHTLRERVCRW
jgi:hypothetical protein